MHPGIFNRVRLFGTQPKQQAPTPTAAAPESTPGAVLPQPTPHEAPVTKLECEGVLARLEYQTSEARRELCEAELRLSRLRRELADATQKRDEFRTKGKLDRKLEDGVIVYAAQIAAAEQGIIAIQEKIECHRLEANHTGQALQHILDRERQQTELERIAHVMDVCAIDRQTVVKLTAEYHLTVEKFREQASHEPDGVVAQRLRASADKLVRLWMGIAEEPPFPQPRRLM